MAVDVQLSYCMTEYTTEIEDYLSARYQIRCMIGDLTVRDQSLIMGTGGTTNWEMGQVLPLYKQKGGGGRIVEIRGDVIKILLCLDGANEKFHTSMF